MAVAYDNPIPGFQTNNTINLRLWAAKPNREFDLEAFNTGDYVQVGLLHHPKETLLIANLGYQCFHSHFMVSKPVCEGIVALFDNQRHCQQLFRASPHEIGSKNIW